MVRTDDYRFERIPAPLISWYRANKRDLPWRENHDPYRVWVSEIMLQQTRVEAVKEYYVRFLTALPTVYDLANCDESLLLKLWEGLGYYSRARNLQKTAKIVCEKYGGKFPETVEELLKLPGIGEYTAGAISSIALYKRAPAIDGNVFRVISRLTENPTEISEPKYRAYLTEKLLEIYPEEGVGCSDFTQSLMELGALICKPQSPDCEICPLSGICRGFENKTQEKFPVLPEKKAKKTEKLCIFLIETPNGLAIRKRGNGVLKGMNEFPSFPKKPWKECLKELGTRDFVLQKQGKFKHIFTHIVWEMDVYYVKASGLDLPCYALAEIENHVSLPTAFKQCLGLLKE